MTDEQGYHFGIMRRAIDVIDAAGGRALSLEELARSLDMSPAHFQGVMLSLFAVGIIFLVVVVIVIGLY